MFKFRSTLVNQLWRYVQCPQSSHEDCNNFEVAEVASVLFSDDRRPLYLRRPSSTSTTTSSENLVITPAKKKQIQAMLMRLKKTQLETLLKAIQTKGWVYQVHIYCQKSALSKVLFLTSQSRRNLGIISAGILEYFFSNFPKSNL